MSYNNWNRSGERIIPIAIDGDGPPSYPPPPPPSSYGRVDPRPTPPGSYGRIDPGPRPQPGPPPQTGPYGRIDPGNWPAPPPRTHYGRDDPGHRPAAYGRDDPGPRPSAYGRDDPGTRPAAYGRDDPGPRPSAYGRDDPGPRPSAYGRDDPGTRPGPAVPSRTPHPPMKDVGRGGSSFRSHDLDEMDALAELLRQKKEAEEGGGSVDSNRNKSYTKWNNYAEGGSQSQPGVPDQIQSSPYPPSPQTDPNNAVPADQQNQGQMGFFSPPSLPYPTQGQDMSPPYPAQGHGMPPPYPGTYPGNPAGSQSQPYPYPTPAPMYPNPYQ